jgi:uncharacterized protein YlxW (UPF0749 family)
MQKKPGMSPIEEKEIRGLSIKNLIAIVSCTVAIVSSVLTTYFLMKSEIQELKNSKVYDEKILDMRFKLLETKYDLLQAQVNEIKK